MIFSNDGSGDCYSFAIELEKICKNKGVEFQYNSNVINFNQKNNQIQSAVYKINHNGNVNVISKVFDELYNFNNKNIFIKCDTEGHEYEVIQGMQKNIKNNNCLIQIEIIHRNFSKLNLLLNELGYKLLKKTIDKDSYFYVNTR